MKAKVIIVISMLTLSVAICLYSMIFVRTAMDRLDSDRVQAVMYVEKGRYEDAEALLTSMITRVTTQSDLFEILTPHNDLHEMLTQLVDAKVSLSIGDMDDFEKAITLFQANVDHIRDHEALTLSNIF